MLIARHDTQAYNARAIQAARVKSWIRHIQATFTSVAESRGELWIMTMIWAQGRIDYSYLSYGAYRCAKEEGLMSVSYAQRHAHCRRPVTCRISDAGRRAAGLLCCQPASLPELPHCAAAVCCAAVQPTAAGRRLLPQCSAWRPVWSRTLTGQPTSNGTGCDQDMD